MQNYLQRGDAIYASAPAGGVVSGQPVTIGTIFTVASETVPAGQVSAFWRKGIYALPKVAAQAWAQGDSLYWDSVNLVLTNVNSGGLLPVGFASDVAANPSSTGNVLIAQAAS